MYDCKKSQNYVASSECTSPVVSIVVPIYQVAQYLDTCIESLVSQTLSDIEIILVDDGSPDNSGNICDAWAQRDNRIKVIHKQNAGLSAAYNTGVTQAQGNYILFVDGDDYIEPNTCEVVVKTAQREGVEVVVFGSKTIYGPDDIEVYDSLYDVVSTKEALCRIFKGGTLPAMSNMRLHSAHIAKKVVFPEGKNYEDVATHIEFLSQTDRVAINLEPLYCYVRRLGSITTEAYNRSRSWDVVEAWEHTRQQVFERYPEDKEMQYAVNSRVYKAYFSILDAMAVPGAESDFDARDKATSFLRAHWWQVLRNPYVRYTRKIGMLVLKLSIDGYMHLARRQYARIR